MKTLGINLETGSLRYCVLEGTKKAPTLIEKDKLDINSATTTDALMNWYDSTFENIINRVQPDAIGCRLALNAKKNQIRYWYYPYGVLNGIAHKKGIPVTEYVTQNFTASKFGLTKGIDLFNHIDIVFGKNPPYWDKSQKNSMLSAWMLLG